MKCNREIAFGCGKGGIACYEKVRGVLYDMGPHPWLASAAESDIPTFPIGTGHTD